MRELRKKHKRYLGLFLTVMMFINTLLNVNAESFGPNDMYTPPNDFEARNSAVSPRAVQLQHNQDGRNGEMLCTFEYGVLEDENGNRVPHEEGGRQVFPLFRSKDNGKTWERENAVIDTNNGWGMGNCPELYELPEPLGDLPAGMILCAGDSVPPVW